MTFLSKPFCFVLAWFYYGTGCMFNWLLNRFPNTQWWVELMYSCYNADMLFSLQCQDFCNGRGKLWPWEQS